MGTPGERGLRPLPLATGSRDCRYFKIIIISIIRFSIISIISISIYFYLY